MVCGVVDVVWCVNKLENEIYLRDVEQSHLTNTLLIPLFPHILCSSVRTLLLDMGPGGIKGVNNQKENKKEIKGNKLKRKKRNKRKPPLATEKTSSKSDILQKEDFSRLVHRLLDR